MNGIVKRFDGNRGFGFIQPLCGDKRAPEVYCHISAVKCRRGQQPAAPPIGAEVKFKLVRGERGPQAAEVELVELGRAALMAADATGDPQT
jgi:cold shock CspA family protein